MPPQRRPQRRETRDSVQQYLDLAGQAQRHTDTIMHNYRAGYNQAEATTIGQDGLVNLESLAGATARDNFYNTFVGSLQQTAAQYMGVNFGNLDIFRKNMLMTGMFGSNVAQIRALVDGLRGNMSFDEMTKLLSKGLETVVQNYRAAATTALKAEDAERVVEYTHTQGMIDPGKLSVLEMAELLGVHKQFGVVPPKVIEGKPYYIQPQAGRGRQ